MLGASVKRAVQILPSTRNSQDLAPIYSMPTKQLEEEFNGLLDETLSAEAEPSSALIQNGAFFLSTNAWMAQETLGRILAIMHAEVLNSGKLLLMVDKALLMEARVASHGADVDHNRTFATAECSDGSNSTFHETFNCVPPRPILPPHPHQ